MHKDPDEELIRDCQSNDRQTAETAFEAMYQSYRDRVFNLALRVLGNESDAEDVTQEAFVTVYRKIGNFRFSSRFYTWLYRVVYNLCVDQRRRRTLGVVGRLEDLPGGEPLTDVEQGPLALVEASETRSRAVERALERLSPPLRVVVVLRYLEELQYSEIAQVLECSVGTVKSRLSRAHHFLQETLRPAD